MSARFHLYLSGVLDRSRSCAETVSVSVASAAALTTRPIQRRRLRVSMSVAALLLAVAEHRQGAVAMVRVRVLCMLSILAPELILISRPRCRPLGRWQVGPSQGMEGYYINCATAAEWSE